MKIQAYLIISKNGSLEVRKNRPSLSNTQIAVKINLNIPDIFFERIVPVVDIELPKEGLFDMNVELATRLTANAVAEKMNLEADRVHDGLMEMIEEKENGNNNRS